MLDDSRTIETEIHEIELKLNRLRDWFNAPDKYRRFNHAELESEIELLFSGLMGLGLSITPVQANRISELHSNFRLLQDLITKLMQKGMNRDSMSG